MWGIIGVVILPETIQVKIQTEEGKVSFASITMEDIIGKFDLEFDAQALKTATRETRRQQAMELLNMAGTAGSDPSTGQYFVDMRKLWEFTLDTFEMSSEEFILTDKEIIKKQFNIEKLKKDAQEKGMSPASQQGLVPP